MWLVDDAAFLHTLTGQLAGMRGVEAVALGGSRATGTHRPDSDWDLAVYYRDGFRPADLRALGYAGDVSEIGGWGGGVFNGGAWLTVDGRAVDVHYRDLASVEYEIAEAEAGRMRIEPLFFHLAGIPTYLLVAELATARVLAGELPRPAYPPALAETAFERWWGAAQLHLAYAQTAHAPAGRTAQCLAMLTLAASQASHAILAVRREWITNEKTLLDRAGLRGVDVIESTVDATPDGLLAACRTVETLCTDAVVAARAG